MFLLDDELRFESNTLPQSPIGSVFKNHLQGGEFVADFVGQGPVLFFAEGGSQVDYKTHDAVDEFIVAGTG